MNLCSETILILLMWHRTYLVQQWLTLIEARLVLLVKEAALVILLQRAWHVRHLRAVGGGGRRAPSRAHGRLAAAAIVAPSLAAGVEATAARVPGASQLGPAFGQIHRILGAAHRRGHSGSL